MATTSTRMSSANVVHHRLSTSHNASTIPFHSTVPSVNDSPTTPSFVFSEDSDRDISSQSDSSLEEVECDTSALPLQNRERRASTRLIAKNAEDIRRITGETKAQLASRCCGGGCCSVSGTSLDAPDDDFEVIQSPENDAYRSLELLISHIPRVLTKIIDLPPQSVYFEPVSKVATPRSTSPLPTTPASSDKTNTPPTLPQISVPRDQNPPLIEKLEKVRIDDTDKTSSSLSSTFPPVYTSPISSADIYKYTNGGVDTSIQPPLFVQPHVPYYVCLARVHNARELTQTGAEKATYHLDLDVTDYPDQEGTDFKVGGAIGVTAPNEETIVDEVFDLLMVPRSLRDKPVMLRTTGGRWPTVWGDDTPRCLPTTRRALLAWCSDLQSLPVNKHVLRLLAEYAEDPVERRILMYLCSAEGQATFCDFRNRNQITTTQLLSAFPSSHPPLGHLLSFLPQLMPRFYSLSNDPHESYQEHDGKRHRLVEIAVTVHSAPDWKHGTRAGLGSGFLQRIAQKFIASKKAIEENESIPSSSVPQVYVPIFKGLMQNPLAKEFVSDGPMLLIGAGVGIAPFRGFVQRRLKLANCANKVWVLQGIRDSLVDEIYSGEWGVHEDKLKTIVESRRGTGKYVQEEVRHQAELVWTIANAVDGRIFVCGSSKGMGEGVEAALIDVAMQKGNLGLEEARRFWDLKRDAGQYIAETW